MARTATMPDPRRGAAERRLRRAKIVIASACAAATFAAWSLVAGSIATTAGSTSAATTFVAPDNGGFFDPGPNLGDAGGQAPLLRSQGS
jgi:hypothetical protein